MKVRTLPAAAFRLLPGFSQARAQMYIAIGVLEYFVRDTGHELTTGQFTPNPIEPRIASGG